MSTCWINTNALRLVLWVAVSACAGTPALAANDFSTAEQALFLDNQLGQMKPPQTLHYAYTRRGSLEPSFDDRVDVAFTAQSDGTCCSASTQFLDRARGAPQPSIDGLRGNPVILYFLERDIHEMQRLTKGQPNYFRNRIRMAIYQERRSCRTVERPYAGRVVTVREITVVPYADDPLRARFERFPTNAMCSSSRAKCPGACMRSRPAWPTAPHSDAPPLVIERLLLEGSRGALKPPANCQFHLDPPTIHLRNPPHVELSRSDLHHVRARRAVRSLAVRRGAANDFPTRERVIYVQECMHAHPGPAFEMTSKCSCALDTIAGEVTHDEYSSMTTIAKAMSIGGERGNTIRDAPGLQPQLKRWRSVEANALRACFIVSEDGK